NGTETKIHTSCSQPIGVGSVFGDFEVTAGESEKGGPLCRIGTPPPPDGECAECEGGLTSLTLKYLADPSTTDHIVVTDKGGKKVLFDDTVTGGETFSFVGQDKGGKMGAEIKVYSNGTETKIHTSCSQPIGVGSVFGDFEVTAGESEKGGPLCRIGTPPPPDGECAECEGGLTSLTLKYLADPSTTDHIVVTDKGGGKVLFDDTVTGGETFSFVGQDRGGKMGAEIKVYSNGMETKIHTSCSQPIGVGSIFGDFEVTAGESEKGGPLP
ncbi:unnamed protein product, partial [marine sediment metagenome]